MTSKPKHMVSSQCRTLVQRHRLEQELHTLVLERRMTEPLQNRYRTMVQAPLVSSRKVPRWLELVWPPHPSRLATAPRQVPQKRPVLTQEQSAMSLHCYSCCN